MVDKILLNETNPPQGQWRNNVSYVSADSYWANGTWDDGGIGNPNGFWGFSDSLIAQYSQLNADRIYFNACDPNSVPACALPYPTYATTLNVEKAITSAISTGRLIVNYIGHSSQTAWLSKGTLSPWFFAADSAQDDVTPLTNGARMPLVLEMTCFTGMFQIPYLTTLAEANVRRANGGALASWAASGQGLAAGHDRLDVGFFDAVLKNGARYIGIATDAGKVQAISYPDLLDTFILFGDPASRLQIQFPINLPLILR
jgi:hypothetical protein